MLLIAEILLTIFAWRRGWKAKALIPVGAAIGVGLIIGIMIASSGSTVPAGVILIDIIAVIALIIMLCNPPKKELDIGAIPKEQVLDLKNVESISEEEPEVKDSN